MGNAGNWFAWSGIFLMFWGLLGGIYLLQSSEIREFRASGMAAKATITSKRSYRERSGSTNTRTTVYLFDVSFFDKSNVDESKIIDVGLYRTAKIQVLGQNYNRYDKGDKVAITFLPDEPDHAKLTEEIENWNGRNLLIFMTLLAVGVVICFFCGVFAYFSGSGELADARALNASSDI